MGERFDDKGEELVYRFLKLANSFGLPEWKRVRFAVTAIEYEAIRKFCLARDGKFTGRIGAVPLSIELAEPKLWVEYKQK